MSQMIESRFLVEWTNAFGAEMFDEGEPVDPVAIALAAYDSIVETRCLYFKITDTETGQCWRVDLDDPEHVETIDAPEQHVCADCGAEGADNEDDTVDPVEYLCDRCSMIRDSAN